MNEPEEFTKGDVVEILGYKYKVKQVDMVFRDSSRPLQYRLEPLDEDAPPATLKPIYDSNAEEDFTVTFTKYCQPEKIE